MFESRRELLFTPDGRVRCLRACFDTVLLSQSPDSNFSRPATGEGHAVPTVPTNQKRETCTATVPTNQKRGTCTAHCADQSEDRDLHCALCRPIKREGHALPLCRLIRREGPALPLCGPIRREGPALSLCRPARRQESALSLCRPSRRQGPALSLCRPTRGGRPALRLRPAGVATRVSYGSLARLLPRLWPAFCLEGARQGADLTSTDCFLPLNTYVCTPTPLADCTSAPAPNGGLTCNGRDTRGFAD